MAFSFVELPWLPPPPPDFSARCREFAEGSGDATRGAQDLANYALNGNQSASLGRAFARRRRRGEGFKGLAKFNLGIVSNAMIDLLADCLPAAALRHGVDLCVTVTPFDQVMQQAMDPQSETNRAGLDAVLLLVDHRWLQFDKPLFGETAAKRVDEAVSQVAGVVADFRENGKLSSILQILPAPPQSLFGSFDLRSAGTVRSMIREFNNAVIELADETGAYLLDTEGLAERIGTDNWFDPVQWAAYKAPFASQFNPAFAEMLGRLLGAIRGKARKCLVLDLDNTLWGGVIGDDGVEGIKLGQGSAVGEAFLAVQQTARDLRSRGIMLAVCSKNDDDVARGPFRSHPDMLLKESDITIFQANWLDKPSNIEAIAKKLNIGLDAVVVLDDNPVERGQIRAALPMVAVPELPSDPIDFARYLTAAGYFETTSFSEEDRLRVESYTSDAQRVDVMAKTRDVGTYLEALEMTLRATPFDRQGRQRITQLINKTNQFNLTTRRYTEAEVASIEADPAVYSLQVRLTDKFGDLGMIGVIIGRDHSKGGEKVRDIDTWLMSCRVLGRKVEDAMLAELVAGAVEAKVGVITATYMPTAKNGMVKDFFGNLGFNLVGEDEKGVRRYAMRISDYSPPRLPLKVERAAQSLVPAE